MPNCLNLNNAPSHTYHVVYGLHHNQSHFTKAHQSWNVF